LCTMRGHFSFPTRRSSDLTTGRELMERMETLAKSGGVSQMELIRLRLEVAGSEKDLSVAQRNLQQVNLDRQRMETEHARLRDEQDRKSTRLNSSHVAISYA